MAPAEIFIVLLRLVVPLAILRRPLAGGIAAMLLDGADVILIELFQESGFTNYHTLDKFLDTYYLALEAFVSLRWDSVLAQRASLALFFYRLLGFVLFELTGRRIFLFLFPNLFENFFLYYVIADRFFSRLRPKTVPSLVAILTLLLIPKMGQEFLLHYLEAQPWNWFKRNVWDPF